MNAIDEHIYVGSLLDAENVVMLVGRPDVDLIIDARMCFTSPPNAQPIVDRVLKAARLLNILASQCDAKVLIHCVWGVDRTPFLAAVYYARRAGVSYKEAYEHINTVYPAAVLHWDWIQVMEEAQHD